MTSAAARDRLRYAVAEHTRATAAPPAPPPREPPPIAAILRGDWHDTPHGPAFVRDDWFSLDHHHGALPLSCALEAPAAGLAHLLGATHAPHPSRLAFFDTETTGVTGGTGTYVVLAGLGSYEDGAFRMRQYFLADLAHERAMLATLAADLARFEGIVTYNGRAFDLPLVDVRMTLARLRAPWAAFAHFDLLHPVRRLYRHRLPACRLADVERRLLRIERPDDIPGSLIPSLYFDYLRAGRAAPLRAVFRHNADDVLSLVGVLAILGRLLAGGDLDPEDAAAVARWWEHAGEPARAAALYTDALPWLEGGDDWPWAAARLAALRKRAGDRDGAAALWRALWSQGDPHAGLELAKHFEHRAGDPRAAAEITRALLVRASAPARMGLEHRLARLRRKLDAPSYPPARHSVRTG
ncbi:MAG TPA: ribonuclease H-like domain-containing protein [Dehalococcoidia bacterium]|nr:ribonuclease H-like domain-containing protein [Dehalococcoidia bacterium]